MIKSKKIARELLKSGSHNLTFNVWRGQYFLNPNLLDSRISDSLSLPLAESLISELSLNKSEHAHGRFTTFLY